MPIYNITIDDVSPIWQWSPGWRADPKGDGAAFEYAGGTFHATNQTDARATLAFNGTAITFFGAQRANHGLFRANVDDQDSNVVYNSRADPQKIKQPLFSAGNLDAGRIHKLSLTNVGNGWFDIDQAVITAGYGDGTSSCKEEKLEDTASSNITYNNWIEYPQGKLSMQYSGSSFHVTTSTNATATISFWGNGAAIYGAVSRNHGPFTVSLDGAPEINLDGASYGFLPQTLLFHFSGLPTGMHSIVVKHTATNGSISTDLDYVMVYQCGSTFSTSVHNPTGKTRVGAIIGGVVGGVVLLTTLILLFWLTWRRRRYRYQDALPTEIRQYPRGYSMLTAAAAPTSTIPTTMQTSTTILMDPLAIPSSGMAPPQYNEIVNYNQDSTLSTTEAVTAAWPRQKRGNVFSRIPP